MPTARRVSMILGMACLISTAALAIWEFFHSFPSNLIGGVMFGKAIAYQFGEVCAEFKYFFIYVAASLAYTKFASPFIRDKYHNSSFATRADGAILWALSFVCFCIILLIVSSFIIGSADFR